jgi:hypothetical protein
VAETARGRPPAGSLAGRPLFVGGEVVKHDDVAGVQRRPEDLVE